MQGFTSKVAEEKSISPGRLRRGSLVANFALTAERELPKAFFPLRAKPPGAVVVFLSGHGHHLGEGAEQLFLAFFLWDQKQEAVKPLIRATILLLIVLN